MVGVLVFVGVLIAVPDNHKSVGYVFGETVNNTGFSGVNFGNIVFFYVFLTGLLMAQYTITGFDASAHMSEETRQASIGAAWGIVMSVVVSVIFGFILLTAVTFALPNATNDEFVGAGQQILTFSWTTAMSESWAEFLLVIAVIAQMFCTIASVTSASRMMFAFSRDGAVPGHRWWRKVSKRDRIPVNTVWAICVLSFLLMIPTLKNAFVGYAVGTSIAVIGLYIAFAIPIYLRVRAGEKFERGAWHLGRHYRWIDWVAVIWIAFICIVFMLPFAKVGIPGNDGLHLGLRELHAASPSARHSCSSAAGTYCPPRSGSRARCVRATRASSSGSNANTRAPKPLPHRPSLPRDKRGIPEGAAKPRPLATLLPSISGGVHGSRNRENAGRPLTFRSCVRRSSPMLNFEDGRWKTARRF